MPTPLPKPVRVTLANDYELVVAGLAGMLAPFADRIDLVDWSISGEKGPTRPTDVVLFDTFGRADLGLAAIPQLLAHPRVDKVVMYTWESEPHLVDRAISAGASGYLSKTVAVPTLVAALEDVAAGRHVIQTRNHPRSWHSVVDWPGRGAGLTEREAEVLALLMSGMRNNEIAAALYISLDTTKTHLKAVYRKLGVRNRAEAGAYAHSHPAFALRGAREEV